MKTYDAVTLRDRVPNPRMPRGQAGMHWATTFKAGEGLTISAQDGVVTLQGPWYAVSVPFEGVVFFDERPIADEPAPQFKPTTLKVKR